MPEVFPKIIGHRGAPHFAPENTMASFKKAVSLGADGLETDVHKTKDGVLVIIHDELLDRTTNGTGLVKDYTLAQLRELSAGVKFSEEFEAEKIPTLEEFLEFVEPLDVFINIELKTGVVLYPDIEKDVIRMVHDYNMQTRTIFSSFNHYALQTCKSIDSEIPTGILYMCGLVDAWDYAQRIGMDALHPLFYNVRPETITGMKKSGLLINPWTVDGLPEMKAMIAMRVDGIITNRCDLLAELKNDMLIGGAV